MTMQLFKFQTNRLGFRPTALLSCSEIMHLKATEKSLERNFRFQNTKHLYSSLSTARLGPTLDTATSLVSRGEKAELPARYRRRFSGPWLSFGFTGNRVYAQLPRLSRVSVHFLQNRWPQQMCPSGISTFFFFSCQYLSHLFPESAAAPKSASVTFRFEVFRTCLLGKHLPCLPAQTFTDCPSSSFPIRFLLLQRAPLCHEVVHHQLISSINRLRSNNCAWHLNHDLFMLPCSCSQRWLLPQHLSSAPKVPFPLTEGVPVLNSAPRASSPPYLTALQLSVAAEDSLFSLPGGDTAHSDEDGPLHWPPRQRSQSYS